MEIDETIYKNRLFVETALINKSIYIIHYPKGKNVKVSYGLLSNIIDNDINHLCCTEEGSSGAPIISLETNKVIGIHIGCTNNNFKFNKGKFIKYSINSFIYHNKIKDEVENIREIYIIPKDEGGSIIPLDVKSSDTLENIKERFKKKSGIKTYVNFFFEKKKCYYETIFDYKIRNESFLEFEGSGIFVKTLPDKVYKIYIDNEKTVKDLKKEIEERLDFPINNQRLYFTGKELEDNRTLLDYKIYDESTVILGMKLNNEENYKEEKKNELQKNVNKKEKEKNIINLFIKNQNGHSFNLISESNNNIKDIKFQITKKYLESKTLVSPNQQILFFNGKILEDNETLSYYNIKNKSMISLKINMNIFVELFNENIIILDVEPDETIERIKIKIKEQEDIPLDNQEYIFFSSRKINDKENLSCLQIQNYSFLNLYKDLKKKVFVKTFKKTIKISIPDFSITVLGLKSLIQCKEDIPIDQQRLIYEGKQLCDDCSLFSYNIHNESTIHVVLRMC